MAQPTNLVSRYNINGVRENLINAIYNVSPEETPVTSSAGTDTADNTFHEWQRDALRAPNKDNAAIDGDDATPSSKGTTSRIGNYCQIFQDTVGTSGRANEVKKAGRDTEQAYQIAKAYKELHRDIEAMAVSANAAVGGNNTTASKSAGFAAMIYTNAQHGVGGSTPTHTSGAQTTGPTAGTARTFTEAQLKAANAAAFAASGAVPDMVVMSPNHKGVFSGFAGIALNRKDIKGKAQAQIVGGADVYVGDFGAQTIVPHWAMVGSTTVLGLKPDQLKVAYLRGFREKKLGPTGDSDKSQILVDCTARVNAEAALWKIADLTP